MNPIFINLKEYYKEKINTHGIVPQGVGWNGEKSQIARFQELLKIINCDNFTLADIGCGYGKLFEFMQQNFTNFKYFGYDLSQEMIENAIKLYSSENKVNFKTIKSIDEIKTVDYSVASGIFNLKMEYTEKQWSSHIIQSLEQMNNKSIKGFSFNLLTKYSDKEYMKNDLYYADPLFLFNYCKKNFSKNVALLHDYNLYDFTILVRKDL